jgi:hypothetical protein
MIYYAHSMTIYGSQREEREFSFLSDLFQKENIFTPNQECIQHASNPMAACLQKIESPDIHALIFSSTASKVSSGVFLEIKYAKKLQKPVYHLLDGILQKCTRLPKRL